MIRRHRGNYTWEGVEAHPYKEEGTHFKTIVRHTLFKSADDLPVEFRYFEVAEGGHSTLERHEHAHLVMVIRGRGEVLVADEVSTIGLYDLVQIPPMTWHQFRATTNEPLGFLCVVNIDRDRPQRPCEEDLQGLAKNASVASFIRS